MKNVKGCPILAMRLSEKPGGSSQIAAAGQSSRQRRRFWPKARRDMGEAVEKGDAGTAVKGRSQMGRGGLWVWVQRGLDGHPSPSVTHPYLAALGHLCPEPNRDKRSHSWCGQVTACPRCPPHPHPSSQTPYRIKLPYWK